MMRLHLLRSIRLLAVLGLCGAAHAGTFYSGLLPFLAAIEPTYYLESFDSLPYQGAGSGGPYSLSGDGFSYTADAPASFFYNTGTLPDIWLSTNNIEAPIRFTFTSGNVTAVGGYFFPQNAGGAVIPGKTTLTFSDGGTITLTNPTDTTFTGYISSTVLTSLIETTSSGTFNTANNLYAGALDH